MQIADAGNRWGWRTRNVFLDCMVACVTMRDANKSWKISKTKTRMHDMSFKLQFSYGLLVIKMEVTKCASSALPGALISKKIKQ
jgi:hypothetical protein